MESGRGVSKEEYKWQLRDGWIPDRDYIFVSYASRDWEKVYPCVMALRSRGINVYIDIEFMENQSSSWLENFQERLFRDSGCKGIVSFLSIDYMRSYACLVEQMANRTGRMRRHAGRLLPVFYVALEPELSSLQRMAAYIYDDDVRRASTGERVEISPPEYTVLQKFILDSSIDAYSDVESVRELLDDIRDKHDVVINMYELIFSDTRYLPNIQLFEGVEKCAQLLTDNFLNEKNDSIKLTILEDLRQKTRKKLGLDVREKSSEAEPEERSTPRPMREEPEERPEPEPVREEPEERPEPEPVREEPKETSEEEPKEEPEAGQADEKPEPKGSAEEPEERTALPKGIICPSCKKINRSGSRFCTGCGMSLTLVQLCGRCKAVLRPGKKFCPKCGARVN